MPVTTKAQLSAENEDSANNVKREYVNSLAKLRNLLKPATFRIGLSLLPAEPRLEEEAIHTGGLKFFAVVYSYKQYQWPQLSYFALTLNYDSAYYKLRPEL